MPRSKKSLTYSQRKRETLDYRAEYFRHNPGLFGCIWTCAYCNKPLLGKQNVVIDHILPLNSPFGRNKRFNLVAACRRCNAKKSDKIDSRVVQGYISKVIQSMIFSVQKVVIVCFVAVWWLIQKVVGTLFSLFKELPFIVKAVAIAIMLLTFYVGVMR